MYLRKHPFDLSIPEEVTNSPIWEPKSRILFVGKLGITEISLRTMAIKIADQLMYGSVRNGRIIYLRVILAESEKGLPEKHWIYYDVGLKGTVFICNGCTDHSG